MDVVDRGPWDIIQQLDRFLAYAAGCKNTKFRRRTRLELPMDVLVQLLDLPEDQIRSGVSAMLGLLAEESTRLYASTFCDRTSPERVRLHQSDLLLKQLIYGT